MDDRELNGLLREWTVPDAPPHLRAPRAQRSRLRWLVSGSLRVPVPAALAALVLIALWIPARQFLMRPEPAPARETPTRGTAAPRPRGELARYALTGKLEGFDAVLTELNFTPGISSQPHRHPGFVLGYVVDGELKTAVNHEADQIVPAGGTFFEPDGALHTTFGSASADAPARVVAFLVVPNGSPLARREP